MFLGNIWRNSIIYLLMTGYKIQCEH